MAKTIKFNLICDGNPVRTIEDLQDNFSIEDILKYYANGLLSRWLSVRGYGEEFKKVSEISCKDDFDVARKLIRIFGVETDEAKIEESIYMLRFIKEREACCDEYKKAGFEVKRIIGDYQAGYQRLVDGILEHPNIASYIKASIAEMVLNYRWALDLNHRELFWTIKDKSALSVMCLLMNEGTRNYFLPVLVEKESNIGSSVLDLDMEKNQDKKEMYEAICKMIREDDFIEKMGDHLHIFSGLTDGYWKDLESREKKVMIIRMEQGDLVRSAGMVGGGMSSRMVTDRFLILDGLDFKSNSPSRKLLYMEV